MKTIAPMLAVALAGAAALTLTTQPLSAQISQEAEACRCVDVDGNELDDCTCFRTPRVDRLLGALAFDAGRPRLGISVDGTQRASLDADGALVTDVMEDGPADRAGLREGDVIESLDGQRLSEPIGGDAEDDFDLDQSVPVQRLLALARELEPGEEVEVVFLRDGERRTVEVQAEDLTESWGRRMSMAGEGWSTERLRDQFRTLGEDMREWGGEVRLRGGHVLPPNGNVRIFGGGGLLYGGMDGLSIVEVNPGLGAYFGTDEGVLVTEVDRRSGLGLEAGDVVLRIGDRAVSTPDRFRRVLGSYGEEEDITFHIMRDGAEVTVTGRLRY